MSQSARAEDIQLEGIIVTLSKTAESAIDALSGSSAVSKEQINQQFQPDRVSEILRTIPGVTTQETARDTAQAVNIRGLQDFGRVNVLIDGMRQNFQRSGHSSNGVFYLEPEMLKGVDITRGPTATIYGSGAIGGVASFELLDADSILRKGESTALRLKTRYSTNGEGFFNSATGAVRADKFDAIGQINGRDISDYTDGSGDTVLNSDEEIQSALVRTRWHSDGHQLVGTFIDYNSEFIDSTITGSTPRDTDVHNTQYNLGYSFARPDSPLLDFNAKIYRNETDLEQTKLTAPSLGSIRSFNLVTEGFDINNTSRFTTGQVQWAFTYGADGFQDTVETRDPAGNGDELTPSGKRQVAGAFVQSKASWGIFDLIGAARYDNYHLEGGDTELDGSRASPKLTAGVTPLAGMTFFATYAEGYRAPAVTETLIAGFHPQPAPFKLLPNPDLSPEVAHNIEGGVNLKYDRIFTANDAFRAKFTVFQNQVDDYIDAVYTPFPLPWGQLQYQNIAEATLEGIEFEGTYDAKSWFLAVGAHRIRGTNDTDGTPLTTVPADQITLTAGMRWMDGKLVTGVRTRFVAAQKDVPDAALAVDGYTVADIFAQYNYSDDLIFNLNVDNVFDKEYVQYLDQSNSPGLNAKISMTMRLGGS